MGISFKWDNGVLRYVAEDQWNWNDYHKAVRIASFSLNNVDHQVDVILDLSQSIKIPSGAVAHLRTLGKKDHPKLTGRGIIINLDHDTRRKLAGNDEDNFQIGEQTIYFVDNEAQAQILLSEFD